MSVFVFKCMRYLAERVTFEPTTGTFYYGTKLSSFKQCMIWNKPSLSLKHCQLLAEFFLKVKHKKKGNIDSSSGKKDVVLVKVMSGKRLCGRTAVFKNTSCELEVLAFWLLRNLRYSI